MRPEASTDQSAAQHSAPIFPVEITHMNEKRIVVNDKMQQNYVCDCTEPAGRNFAVDFQPDLSPKSMLELGVFGGHYMTDCGSEFPPDWFASARLSPECHDAESNLIGVTASQTLTHWKNKVWVHSDAGQDDYETYKRHTPVLVPWSRTRD